MKKIIMLLTFIKIISNSYAQSNNLFYYSFDKKIYLTHISNKYVAEFNTEKDSTFFTARNVLSKKIDGKTFEVEGDYNTLNAIGDGEVLLNPVYKTANGIDVKIKNQIVLQWKSNTTIIQKTLLINQLNLVEIKTTRLFTIFKTINPLLISQLVYESGLVRYCNPVFLTKIIDFDSPDQKEFVFVGPKNEKK